jgi:cyanophycinase
MATYALLGAGEFEPWSGVVDRAVLERAPHPDGTVLVLPTASAHEGETVFRGWGDKGVEHYRSLGVPVAFLELRTREDADDERFVRALDDASFVFFSGGNPARLAGALVGSAFWAALQDRMRDGLPYAGCSAGVAVLTERTFDSEVGIFGDEVWAAGLGFVRGAVFGPHWDMVDRWFPGATDFIVASVREGEVFVGLDEDTAIVGDGTTWSVLGRQKIHVRRDGEWTSYADGDTFELPLDVAL